MAIEPQETFHEMFTNMYNRATPRVKDAFIMMSKNTARQIRAETRLEYAQKHEKHLLEKVKQLEALNEKLERENRLLRATIKICGGAA